MEQMTLTVACRKFLSLPGESLVDFKAQMDKLYAKDRDDLKRDFLAVGVEIVPAGKPSPPGKGLTVWEEV